MSCADTFQIYPLLPSQSYWEMKWSRSEYLSCGDLLKYINKQWQHGPHKKKTNNQYDWQQRTNSQSIKNTADHTFSQIMSKLVARFQLSDWHNWQRFKPLVPTAMAVWSQMDVEWGCNWWLFSLLINQSVVFPINHSENCNNVYPSYSELEATSKDCSFCLFQSSNIFGFSFSCHTLKT